MADRVIHADHGDDSPPISFDRGVAPLALLLVAVSVVAALVPLYVYPNLGGFAALAAMALAFATVAGLTWLVLRYEGLTAEDVGLGGADVVPGVLAVAGLYLFINAVAAVFAFRATGTVRFVVPGETPAGVWVAMALVQVLFVGITEEFAFRAYVQNKLIALLGGGTDRVRKAGAILLGVFLFTLWHIPQRLFAQGLTSPGQILGTLVAVVILGTFLGLVYEYTRNVVLGGVLHGTFNWSFVFVADGSGDLAMLVALPAFVLIAWYYRRWATAKHVTGFGPQRQVRAAR
ncbi:CPBP family intramembrane glutamic endopeptidase [Halobacteriaceae archaeon GCM10025711]